MASLRCAKCKQSVPMLRSMRLRTADTAEKGVCPLCFDRIMAWREKRGLDRHLREVKK